MGSCDIIYHLSVRLLVYMINQKRGVQGAGPSRKGGGVLDADQVARGVFTATHTCVTFGVVGRAH